MFTEVSLSYLAETDKVVEIKYDFISNDESLEFEMFGPRVYESTLENYIKDTKTEN